MRQKLVLAIPVVALISSVVFPMVAMTAQNPAPISLEEQLQAQYELARLDLNQKEVREPGTVLVIQKEGVFAVAANLIPCPSIYEDGRLRPPVGPCVASVKSSSRYFQVGEKVSPTQIAVDMKKGTIALAIISPTTFYKGRVIFQFRTGYLEKASVPAVEDTIGEVLAIYTPPTEAPPTASTEQPAAVGATPGQALTNDDIIKLVQIKLGDSLIITKIKSSACSFDTSTDALVKLKQAGVSDAVLQAMVEGGGQPTAPPPPVPEKTPTIRSDSSKASYRRMDFGFNGCDVQFGELKTRVSEADMVRLAAAASAKGFAYHPSLRYGRLIIGDYPEACRSPANLSWPLYLKVD